MLYDERVDTSSSVVPCTAHKSTPAIDNRGRHISSAVSNHSQCSLPCDSFIRHIVVVCLLAAPQACWRYRSGWPHSVSLCQSPAMQLWDCNSASSQMTYAVCFAVDSFIRHIVVVCPQAAPRACWRYRSGWPHSVSLCQSPAMQLWDCNSASSQMTYAMCFAVYRYWREKV